MIGALICSASLSSVPIRKAIAVLLSAIVAPSSAAFTATFQAIDSSLSAPKMMPRLPFNKL
ncbi:Uncharacterised protein [Segatella copri]|nr:Uncharacterised protein [Segatella copri]